MIFYNLIFLFLLLYTRSYIREYLFKELEDHIRLKVKAQSKIARTISQG